MNPTPPHTERADEAPPSSEAPPSRHSAAHAAPGRGFWILLGVGIVFVGAVAWFQFDRVDDARRGRARPEPPPVLYNLPDFSLIERDGSRVTLSDLRGKIWIADFIFTNCGGPCPIMTRRMRDLHDALAAQGIHDVTMVSISVDPDRDTPEALREYTDLFNVGDRNWLFLTGDEKAIHDLSIGGFKLPASQAEDSDQVEHSPRFVLVDPHGRIRGYYEIVTDEEIFQMPRAEAIERPIPRESLERLLTDIRALRSEAGA